MLARQVFLALHLGEAARGARESGAQALALVETCWRGVRGYHQVDVVIVELVDERDEAPRLVVASLVHHRHPREQHRLEAARDVDVVVLAARSSAQRRELEPY